MCIHMPEENWLAMLEFVPRRVLGNKVDKVGNRYFAKIAQDCLHCPFKHITIGDFHISTGANYQAELRKDGGIVPIAEVDMPENIRSCDRIYIGRLDSTGLQFLGRMRALFHNVALDFDSVGSRGMHLLTSTTALARVALSLHKLLPLISGPVELIGVGRVFLPILHENFSATFLNTKFMNVWIEENITNDPTTAVVLADWLFTPLGDGQSQPRVLMFYLNYYNHNDTNEAKQNALAMERATIQQITTILQQRFMNPARQQASPFSVVIRIYSNQALDHVNSVVENGRTGEKLIMRGRGTNLVLLNCAIDVDSAWVAQKEREVIAMDLLEILHAEKKQPTFRFV